MARAGQASDTHDERDLAAADDAPEVGRSSYDEIPPPPPFASSEAHEERQARALTWPCAEPMARFAVYDVLGRVAAGRVADTYLAREPLGPGEQRLVALAVLRPGSVSDEAAFVRQGRTWAALGHPHLARVYEVGVWRGRPFIASQWARGVPLSQLIGEQGRPRVPLPLPLTLRVIANVASALDRLHRVRSRDGRLLGLVHGRIRAENIVITPEGGVVLVGGALGHLTQRYDETGGYRAPERCRGELPDGRSDLFSLGVCMHEALVRAPLFARGSEEETRRAILEAEPPALGMVEPAARALEQTLQLTLAKRAELRFQSAGELQFAIERHLLDLGCVVLRRHLADWVRDHAEEQAPALDTSTEALERLAPHAAASGLVPASSGVVRVLPSRGRARRRWLVGLALLCMAATAVWLALAARAPAPDGGVSPAARVLPTAP